jgi:NADH-quinone oxidoreductase subunit J
VTALTIVVGILALVSAIGVVSFRSTIYCALSLVGNMIMLATLFLLLNAQFLAAVQVIIYAGAVMVLFIFIIALLSPGSEDGPSLDLRFMVGIVAVVYVTLQIMFLVGNGKTYDTTAVACTSATQQDCSKTPLRGGRNGSAVNPGALSFFPDDVNRAGNVQVLGGQLFTTFLLPFEITSLLLIVAAIGAVYLTRHHYSGSRRT